MLLFLIYVMDFFLQCASVTSGFDFFLYIYILHDSKETGEGRGYDTPSGQTQSNRTGQAMGYGLWAMASEY